MKTYTIYDTTSGAIISSGHCSLDSDAALQPVPTGAALMVGTEASPGRHKIVNGKMEDVPPAAPVVQIDRLDLIIEALKSKGVTISKADLLAAAGRLKQ